MIASAAPLVFLVDDDASVRKSLARLVKTAGYEAELFASVPDFLARAPYDGPCCLVLDLSTAQADRLPHRFPAAQPTLAK